MQSTLAQVHTEAADFVSRGGLDMVAEEDGAESESDESVTSDSSADSMTLADRIDDALVLSDIDAIRAVVDEAHREGSAHPGLIALEHKLAGLEEQIAAAIEMHAAPLEARSAARAPFPSRFAPRHRRRRRSAATARPASAAGGARR